MFGETQTLVKKLLPWLRAKKLAYEEQGVAATLDLLIKDLEKTL